jgi:hypothetical protein
VLLVEEELSTRTVSPPLVAPVVLLLTSGQFLFH